jgi:phosphatidylserine synthase
VNTLPGASPLANYLDRWGLAGPGVWLVLIGLVALATIAGSSGRTASWPVGLPAVVAAAFLAGLVWPYAVGGFGRSIGIWIVVIGAVVLLVGGLLARQARHERGDATV